MGKNASKQPKVPRSPKHFEPFVSVSVESLHEKLYNQVFKLILEKGLCNTEDQGEHPYNFKSPDELSSMIDFSLGAHGVDHKNLLKILEQVIQFSPHVNHPLYLDKFSAGLNVYAIVGETLGTAISSPAVTYFFGPVFTLMEEEVKRKLRLLIGYPDGTGDGIVSPGAGFASVMALRLALHSKYPNLKTKGYSGTGNPKLCFFVSEHATVAFRKAAFIVGIGEQGCISIKTDLKGRMNTDSLKFELENAKANGLEPIMVVATAGTELLGAIDPLAKIASICKLENMWLHVDADYAGPLLLSDAHKQKLNGIKQSDSVSWGAVGMLGSTQCSNFLLTRHHDLFLETFGTSAKYLFTKTDLYDTKWDNGDRTLQTTRRADILKFWLMWKAMGKRGLAEHVDNIMELSKYFISEISKRNQAFSLVLEDFDTTKSSFYYVPPCLRNSALWQDRSNGIMSEFTHKLKAKLVSDGAMHIGVSSFITQPDCFTISLTNAAVNKHHLSNILNNLEKYGKDLSTLLHQSLSTEFSKDTNFSHKFEEEHDVDLHETCDKASLTDATSSTFNEDFLKEVFKIVQEETLYFQNKRSKTPYHFREPEILLKEFDFELGDTPQTPKTILEIIKKIIFYSTLQAHPYFVVQLLSAGMDPYSIMAEFVLATQPSSMRNYESAPVYSLMEKEVFQKVREIVGYPNGEGDGTICPGGSISVITALYVAIATKFPECRKVGLSHLGKNLVVYLSENGHYCFKKGSLLQGIGIDNCVTIKSDESGKMMVSELRKAIQKSIEIGDVPLLVGATSGTTVIGSFDNLEEISQICQEYGIWLHSDGSLGGSVMMSESKRKKYLTGVEKVDSINFNAHKLFGVPLEGSIIVFKQKNILAKTFGVQNLIDFPLTQLYNSNPFHDNGAGGLQMDRRPNIIKFWFLWKAKGTIGMEKHVDYVYSIKDYAVLQIKRRSKAFQLWKPDFEFPAVCFLYIPKILRRLDRNSEEFRTKIDEVANLLRNKLLFKTSIVIGTMRDRDSPNLLKMVLMSSGLSHQDIDYMLDQIDKYGQNFELGGGDSHFTKS